MCFFWLIIKYIAQNTDQSSRLRSQGFGNSAVVAKIAAGDKPNRTLEGLHKWVKASAQGETEGSGKGEGEGDGQEEGEDTTAAVEVQVPTILTFAFKAADLGLGKNVSIRVQQDGTMVSSNTAYEINMALEFLKAAIEAR